MKSNLLSRHDLSRAEETKKDIEMLSTLSPEIFPAFMDAMPEIFMARSNVEDRKLRIALSNKVGIPLSILGHSIDMASYFLHSFTDPELAENDSPQEIAEDLRELSLIPPEKEKQIAELLAGLMRHATIIKQDEAQQKTLSSGVPLLGSVSFVVDQRCIFDHNFKFVEGIENYKPKCVGVVPIALFTFKQTGEDKNEFKFSADRRTLDLLTKFVEAANIQLDAAEKYLNIK